MPLIERWGSGPLRQRRLAALVVGLSACSHYGLHDIRESTGPGGASGGDTREPPVPVPIACILLVDPPSVAPPHTCPDASSADGPLNMALVWEHDDPAFVGSLAWVITPIDDTNHDGRVSQVDDAAVIAFTQKSVVALDGRSGDAVWSVPGEFTPTLAAAAANLDGSGTVQIVATTGSVGIGSRYDLLGIRASTGATLWTSSTNLEEVAPGYRGAPFIADLDGDGLAEIGFGRAIFNNFGMLVATGALTAGAQSTTGGLGQPIAVDLDGDGRPEDLAGPTAYEPDGTVLWHNTDLPDGNDVVADFDGDGEPDIVLLSYGQAWGLDHAGMLQWGPIRLAGKCTNPHTGGSGPAAVEDLDGDGHPDFVVPCSNKLGAYHWGGDTMWTADIVDRSTAAGAAIADLDGDGIPEVVFVGEDWTYVFAGRTGVLRWEAPRSSNTAIETAEFADVDGDGQIEMIVATDGAMQVWRADPAGPSDLHVWNEHSFHLTDLNDDLTVPSVSPPYWLSTNSFRSAGLSHRWGDANLAPTIVNVCEAACDAGWVVLDAVVANGGDDDVPAGVRVDLTAGQGGKLVATTTTTRPIPAHGQGEVLRFSVDAADLQGTMPTVSVDPERAVPQCDLTDDVTTWSDTVCGG